jgi:cadmium resistance protein CadD (predicted permease)
VDDRRILVLIRCEVESLLTLIGVAIVVFASTNIDDAFVLIAFFADKGFSAGDVVIGQYGGMGAMFGVSALAALIFLIIPPSYVGLLGLAPIAIGARKLYNLRQRWKKEEDPRRVSSTGTHRRMLAVAAVTLANGGDNIANYTALFATISRSEFPAIGIAFAVMTGLWCLAAYWLVNHGAVGAPVRYHAHRVVPFVLIGLGVLILIRSGTVQLLEECLLSTVQMLTKTLSS